MNNSGAPLQISRNHEGVETWTLNRPETRNPISDVDMVDAITQAVDRVSGDLDCGAVVLTGAGSAFSAGGDVRAMRDREGMFGDPPALQRTGYQRGIQRLTRTLVGCDVPVIAAVNGPAIGAGFDLALMCDLRVASTEASFAASFVRLGLIPGDGGAWLLPRVVGHARAVELALTGRRIDASTAAQWGVVSTVVEPDQVLKAAEMLATDIAALPRTAVRMTKSLLRRSGDLGLADTLELSSALQPLCHATLEHRELVADFSTRSGR